MNKMAKKPFEEGDVILIEMINGRNIEATFIRSRNDGVVVKNGKEAGSNRVSKSIQSFFANEIKKVHLVRRAPAVVVKKSSGANEEQPVASTSESISKQHENSKYNTRTENTTPQNSNNNSVVVERGSVKERISKYRSEKRNFTELEIETIQQRVNGTIQIAQHDEKYHNAMKDLQQQEIISVNSENKFGRLEPSRPLLTFATTQNVYIFDMVRLGAMKKEMKEIFSADLPRKIVHSSTELADYLFHKEKCELNNIFDTLLVHYNLTKSRKHISLQECYKTYFELPDDFVLQNFNYQTRPLSKEALIRASLNGILIMKMYFHMNDILTRPIYTASKQFSQIYPDVGHSVDLMTLMNTKSHPGTEDIELNAIEHLEEELQLLEVK